MAANSSIWKPNNLSDRSGDFLFRFLSEQNLKRFLKTGNIWFARGDTFGDKMECVSVKDFKNNAFDLTTMRLRQRHHFISCWHINTHESLAFWDTYAKTEDGRRKYAIRFRREELITYITGVKLLTAGVASRLYGNLSYKNLISADLSSILKAKVPYVSFRKDKVFEYENEIRFFLVKQTEGIEKGINLHIGLAIDLPFKILINPLLDQKAFADSLKFLNKSEFKKKIAFSKLTMWLNPELAKLIDKHTIVSKNNVSHKKLMI